MGTVGALRDQATLKKETISNVDILNKIQPIPAHLSRLIFKEKALEKPTKVLFNHLSHYLLSIIDPNVSASVTWPLYDTKDERAYRTEFASFISDYSSKGLLTPVMSSYLVNPGCYKVTKLIFQLSQLAVNRMLQAKMKNDHQKELYTRMTEKYKNNQQDFAECAETETQAIYNRFSNYLQKKKAMEKIAALFRKKIMDMEARLSSSGAQNYINNLVDRFLEVHDVDDETKLELLKVKDVKTQPIIFDAWLEHADATLDSIEEAWNTKVPPLLQSCQNLFISTETLIAKSMGESDPSTYTVEYNHIHDEICTKDLQNYANGEQKYVLKNLVKDGQLNFPNLIRAFVISICFVLNNSEIGDEIYHFNELLSRRTYFDISSKLRILIQRLQNVQAKLPPEPIPHDDGSSVMDLPEIPPLIDLSTLTANVDPNDLLFDTFTPLNFAKNKFNLRGKTSASSCAKLQPKFLTSMFHKTFTDGFLKLPYDRKTHVADNMSIRSNINRENNFNMTISSSVTRANETNPDCTTGFTKQQILRLLSTKKSSSSKKHKLSIERGNLKIKRGGMFNQSAAPCESKVLLRSHSSPNLYDNRENRCISKGRARKLSIMEEADGSPILEMSGIAALCREVNYSISQEFGNAESSRIVTDTSSMPSVAATSETKGGINNFLNIERSLDRDMGINGISPILEVPRISIEHIDRLGVRNETPKTNANMSNKTSSLEKIINRFKKVRTNKLSEKNVDLDEMKTVVDDNVMNAKADVLAVNRNLLPDLLSLNCSSVQDRSINDMDWPDSINLDKDKVKRKKGRQSLGTALGVDENFLDQFDFID